MRWWLVGLVTLSVSVAAWEPEVPKVWDDDALHGMELPIVGLGKPANHVSSEYYYRIPVTPIPKTYPVYAPAILSGGDRFLETKNEGRVDSSRPTRLRCTVSTQPSNGPDSRRVEKVRRRRAIPSRGKRRHVPLVRYWVVEKGDVRAAYTECGSCHTRVLDGGTIVPGAQGNIEEARQKAYTRANGGEEGLVRWLKRNRMSHAAPWLKPNPAHLYDTLTIEQAVEIERSLRAGMAIRDGTTHLYPPKMPDLIGVEDREYLDATGLIRHRSIADLMRYATIVDGAEQYMDFDGFRPWGQLPEPSSLGRFSDEALYALALYIYSLEPPPNPNKPSPLSRHGEEVFHREGCAGCHTPPLYTNNMLTPVDGFVVPAGHDGTDDILHVNVGTDARLALRSRKGTGYYRVPSLKGVWYRGPFEHNGSVATLEDWFDPARLDDDYVPTAFVGYGIETRAVPGHEFGLALSAEDKKALIAFLKTL